MKFGGDPAPVTVDQFTGSITTSPAGVFGTLGARVKVTFPGVDVTAAASVAINTTPNTAGGIAGNSLKVSANLTMAILGQSLAGNFTFEQVTAPVSPQAPPGTAGAKIIRIGVTGLDLFIGDPGTDTVNHSTAPASGSRTAPRSSSCVPPASPAGSRARSSSRSPATRSSSAARSASRSTRPAPASRSR